MKKMQNVCYAVKYEIKIYTFRFIRNKTGAVFPRNTLKEVYTIPIEYCCCKMGVEL